MKNPPQKIGNTNVLIFTKVDDRQTHIGKTRHFYENQR
jgi:hypothetical protein